MGGGAARCMSGPTARSSSRCGREARRQRMSRPSSRVPREGAAVPGDRRGVPSAADDDGGSKLVHATRRPVQPPLQRAASPGGHLYLSNATRPAQSRCRGRLFRRAVCSRGGGHGSVLLVLFCAVVGDAESQSPHPSAGPGGGRDNLPQLARHLGSVRGGRGGGESRRRTPQQQHNPPTARKPLHSC